jgi:hypothetical protein
MIHHPLRPLTTVPVALVERLLVRALCRGDSDDADRATIELYLLLLAEMERSLPADDAESAPCLVATLMFAMARRFLTGPQGAPSAAALAVPRPFEPTRFAA